MLARFGTLTRTHAAALALALTVASLTAFPQLIAEKRMGATYQGVHPVVIDDQLYYLARAHETLDGHPTLGNPYLAEYKDVPGVQFWIPDMVLAKISLFFGGLRAGALVFDFVFPFLIVLVSYAILFVLTRDRLLSVAFAALLDPGLVFISFLRTPNPQLLVVLFAALLALLLYFEKKKTGLALSALLLGASLFYIYPFYWTYWVVMMAVAVPAAFLFVRESRAHRALLGILLGAILLGIPYFLDTFTETKLSYYRESLARIGAIETHMPSGLFIVSLVVVTLTVMGWCWWKKVIPRTPAIVLIASSVAAGAVVTNQHIITGLNYFFTVHYTMFVQFMSVFALAACVPWLLDRYVAPEHRARVRLVLIFALLLFSVYKVLPQVERLATPQIADIQAQRYGPILSWLDANTATDDVVYADDTLASYIPAYTRDNVFFAPLVFNTYLPQAVVEERYLRAHYFDALTREKIIATEYDVFGAYYVGRWAHAQTTNRLLRLLGLREHIVEEHPEADIQRLLAEATTLQRGSFTEALVDYRLDYLVWDTEKSPAWKIPSDFKKLFEANGLIVYASPTTPP